MKKSRLFLAVFLFLFALAELPVRAQTLISGFPETNGEVKCLALRGNVLYLGGAFSMIGGAARTNAAAIDLLNLQVLPWAPEPDNAVVDIEVTGNAVFLAGGFMNIDTSARNSVAAVDPVTGTVLPWNPNIVFPGIPGMQTGSISDVEISGDTVYLSGYFISINGQNYSNLAAVSASDGTTLNWSPNPNIPVNFSRVRGDKIYVAGPFGNIGGANRDGFARLDRTTALADGWNPQPNNPGNEWNDVLWMGTDLYLAGPFTQLGGTPVNLCGKINANATAYSAFNTGFYFNPQDYQPVLALGEYHGHIVAGGDFRPFQSIPGYLTFLDPGTGQPNSWDPVLNAKVTDLLIWGDTLIAAGAFTLENGNPREGLAAWYEPFSSVSEPQEVKIQVWPNPAEDVLKIKSGASVQSLRLLDLAGKPVFEENGMFENRFDFSLEVERFPAGVYLLELSGNDWREVKKVVLR